MSQPRNQYWRTIKPVKGEPIPDGAEFSRNGKTWFGHDNETIREFLEGDEVVLQWRVPVPVVPLSVAVDAICDLATRGTGEYWQLFFTRDLVSAPSREQLRELVTAKLIELAEQERLRVH